MAQKVLHREFEEAVRARTALLEARAHVEDQLHQLDVIIMLKEAEIQVRKEIEKGEQSTSDQ
jgi:hypothetical protein